MLYLQLFTIELLNHYSGKRKLTVVHRTTAAFQPRGRNVFVCTASSLALGPTPDYNGCLWIKRLTRESEHSPPSAAEVKNEWSLTSTSLICFHAVRKKNFAFRYNVLLLTLTL